ncbi:cation:proton antiporter [archaeon]|nr:cation:proton antiporter [archaeon]
MMFWVAAIIVTLFGLIALARVLKGPHIADRVVAFSTVNTLVVIAMILISAAQKSVLYVDIAIVYALLSFVGTLFIAKHLEGNS